MEQLWKSSTDYIICTLSPSAVQLKNTFPRSQTKTEPYKIKETALFLFLVWILVLKTITSLQVFRSSTPRDTIYMVSDGVRL